MNDTDNLWSHFEQQSQESIEKRGEFEALRRWVIAELGVTHEDSHKVARQIFKARKKQFKEKRKCLNGSEN